MDIYIQSSGISQDYRWVKINGVKKPERKSPPIPPQAIELIDTDDYSVILGRFDNQLILLVTGLETEKRTDDRHRPIRNSVAWVVSEKFEEAFIQELTVQALRDELAKIIDNAVISKGENGFSVMQENLPKPQAIHGKSSPDTASEIRDLSPENKKHLAREIKELQSLPGNHEFELLVVVTDIKTKEDLQKAKVWRGLSSRNINHVDKQGITNQPTKEKKSQRISVVFKTIAQIFRKSVQIALVISLAVNALLFQQWMMQQQGIRNLESRVEILQNQKVEIDKLREQERQHKEAALLQLEQERQRYQDLLVKVQHP